MSIGMAFWVLMIIWAAFGLWWHWPNYGPLGSNLLLFLLIGLLGWHAFGAPIR